MIKYLIGFLILWVSHGARAQETTLKNGIILRTSQKIKAGLYSFKTSENLDKAVIIIEGSDITIDFNNAVVKGGLPGEAPDHFKGIAVYIRSGKNITVKNLSIHGYKIALLARNIEGLKIENCDLSYNYRPHLNSTQEQEDISDWMSYHHNENNEWMRYGAGIYLQGCNNATVANCKVTGGQNALMLMQCINGMIYNNDFSFNSGIGLGMYRCSGNKVCYNRIIFNVRGYSHGVYNRGQDSAGILIYEQSNNNLFYKNAVTHGGDGFFLWAGQTTMDTGKGGCNDNVLLDNDFSYAPTNGIEATFSRNKIIHNRVFECDHGIWAGYSYETDISNNQFRYNRIAIAIEHGLNNSIHHNIFYEDKEAIKLWSDKTQSPGWGYPKYRDTRSAAYTIAGNSFNKNPIVYDITRTDSLKIFDNRVSLCDVEYQIDSTVTAIDTSFHEDLMYQLSEDYKPDLPEIKNAKDPFKGNGKLAGRKNIMITEWGPYNFGYPLVWNTNPTDTSGKMVFNILGPTGKWKIVSIKGIKNISIKKGVLPATFTAEKVGGLKSDIEIVAEYKGSKFSDQWGNTISAGKPFRFKFRKFFQPIDFTVKWYAIDSFNFKDSNAIPAITIQPPFKTDTVNQLNYAWWGGMREANKQYVKFLTLAEGKADMDAGKYELSVSWDDAVKLYVDGKLIIKEWDPSQYVFDESPNRRAIIHVKKGIHYFRVEHVELGNFATLSLKLQKLDD
ncbi:right-handed parallel beta-helix repeat-containing protein [Flavisolibacter ginsengisoli]|nr:right-handed parallel beta-helix repeat-containing protein [Flavisolibacter ginsengisoli]